MDETPVQTQEPAYQPKFGTRLIIWGSVYAAPQVTYFIYAVATDPKPDPSVLGLLLLFLFFPIGISDLLSEFLHSFIYFAPGSEDPLVAFGYLLYLGHLIFSLCVPSKNSFKVAMIVLIIIIIFNLVGCMRINNSLSHFSP